MDVALLRLIAFHMVIFSFFLMKISKATPSVIDARGKSMSREVQNGVAYANFKGHKFSYLNITALATDVVATSSQCGTACVNIPSCFSFNLAAFSDINGKLSCELLPSDKYNNSNKVVATQFYHHFSIRSPCLSGPCQNNGTCVSLYENNSHVCLCNQEYKGKNCDTLVDKCTSNPCQNQGTCNTLVDAYNCTCQMGFDGVNCEKELPFNSSILRDNEFYVSHLMQFLAPAVGDHSKWLLCYRASIHGWGISEWHSGCDGKNDTVAIIKSGEYVFGGYTDIPWASGDDYGNTPEAFIFSLNNKEGSVPFKATVSVASQAIYRSASHGIAFGKLGTMDLYIADDAIKNADSQSFFGFSYSQPSGIQDPMTILAGGYTFTPDEVEMFYLQVVV